MISAKFIFRLADEILRLRSLLLSALSRSRTPDRIGTARRPHAGIIHRDLKSDNVFLTDKDEASDHVKVLDFGISRFLEAREGTRTRRHLVGTPEFMRPSRSCTRYVDRRADIYALGVVLYEMLTGHVPFEIDFPARMGARPGCRSGAPPARSDHQRPSSAARVSRRPRGTGRDDQPDARERAPTLASRR